MVDISGAETPVLDRAIAAYRNGELVEAERLCRQIVAARPHFFVALHLLAVVQSRLGKSAEALAAFDRALAVRSDIVAAHYERGILLARLRRHDEALASYDRALTLRPDNAEALCNRGNVLQTLRRYHEALANYDRALALRPDFVDVLSNRGALLIKLDRHEEALASYDRALALRPDYAEALANRGNALQKLRRYHEALASYDRAQTVSPDHAEAHFGEAEIRLLLGDFERGWQKYEWRWQAQQLRGHEQKFEAPRWRGEHEITGKTVLLHAEQGFGDTIQFVRYAPLVAARGAAVILQVQPQLVRLLSRVAGVASVVARGAPLPDFDFHCPLLSLPLAFKTRPETIPAVSPYLSPAPEDSAKWEARLAPPRRPRIGFSWSGRPMHQHDRQRSIPLEALVPLLDADATFVSLQKDVRPADRTVLQEQARIIHLGDELADFADTAAVIANLDLMIAADTGVAHLAGALGKPVWVLLAHMPDWRWFLDRDDSPWYPTARLFRQDDSRAWDGVVARVHAALQDFVVRGRIA